MKEMILVYSTEPRKRESLIDDSQGEEGHTAR